MELESTIFATTSCQIWKNRNRKSSDNFDSHKNIIISYSKEILEAFQSLLLGGLHVNWLNWLPTVTCNHMDATSKQQSSWLQWIIQDSSLGMGARPLWETHKQLETWNQTLEHLWWTRHHVWNWSRFVGSSKIIREESNQTHSHRALLEDSRFLLNRTGSMISHIYLQANQSADHLVMWEWDNWKNLWSVSQSPPSVFVLFRSTKNKF